MNKADYKFHRDKKQEIERNARQSEETISWSWKPKPSNTPIYIPKKKKKK